MDQKLIYVSSVYFWFEFMSVWSSSIPKSEIKLGEHHSGKSVSSFQNLMPQSFSGYDRLLACWQWAIEKPHLEFLFIIFMFFLLVSRFIIASLAPAVVNTCVFHLRKTSESQKCQDCVAKQYLLFLKLLERLGQLPSFFLLTLSKSLLGAKKKCPLGCIPWRNTSKMGRSLGP